MGSAKSNKNMHLRKHGGSQLSRNQNTRKRTRESRESRECGVSQISRDRNKNKEHVRSESAAGPIYDRIKINRKDLRANKEEGVMDPG